MEEQRRFAPDITDREMFWAAMRAPLQGADAHVERFVLAVATCWVRPGDFVIELGSNHGQHARVFARHVGVQGRLLLVEADPSLAERLVAGVARSDVPMTVLNVAASNRSGGFATFFRHPTRDQEGSLYRREDVRYEEVRVGVVALDDLVTEYGEPRLVKIDVEGAEFRVLEGATQLLSEGSPLIACEISADRELETASTLHYRLSDLLDLLERHGWRLHTLDGTCVERRDVHDPRFRLHYQCWLARAGTEAHEFVRVMVPSLARAYAWGATSSPPYPFHLDTHPIRIAEDGARVDAQQPN